MDNEEQVIVVKKALDLTVKIAREEKKIGQIEFETYSPMPAAPVRQLVAKKYPEISTKYKTIDWLLPFIPTIGYFLFSISSGSHVFLSIVFSFVIFVGSTIIYFIYRSLFYHLVGKQLMADSKKYRAKCAEIDRAAAEQQRIADEQYFAKKREYDQVTLPAYQKGFLEWKEMQEQKIAVIENELEQLRAELELHYESTKLIPLQYRQKSTLRYLYDLMSTSNYDIKAAIELYDRKAQRDLDDTRLQAQRRANALADEQSALLDEQNALLAQQNAIANQARHEARQAAIVAAVQRHNANNLLKERNEKMK